MRHVVDQRIDEQYKGIRSRNAWSLAKCFAQSHNCQSSERCTKNNVGWVEWLFVQVCRVETPIAGPHIHHSAYRTPHDDSRIASHHIECLAPFFGHVRLFAYPLKFRQLGRVVATRVKRPVPPVQLVSIVAVEEHHRQRVLQEYRVMKRPVVVNQPRCKREYQGEPGDGCRNAPLSFLPLESPTNPAAEERQRA